MDVMESISTEFYNIENNNNNKNPRSYLLKYNFGGEEENEWRACNDREDKKKEKEKALAPWDLSLLCYQSRGS